ncbi:VCBS repeat protein [Arenibacter algicola]|uniref:VCBS repeat protein n=1 Tax=Arenibacter algicola TaxID=616991 RepID=A0ABY3AKY3_9FLAO
MKNDSICYGTKLLILGFGIQLILSCSGTSSKVSDEQSINSKYNELFTILSVDDTGIDFKNELKESLTMNGLFYEYFYNGGGVAVGDLNGDGKTDIYFISNLESNKLYLNKGQLKFKDVTTLSGIGGGYGFPTGVTLVDINADGKLDIYVCRSGKFKDADKRRNQLFVNQGNNEDGIPIFKEESQKYNLDLPHFSTQAAFFDHDRDGDLDMFLINHGLEVYGDEVISQYLSEESEYRGERLFENLNGKFVDVTTKSGIINNMLGFCLGLSIGDFNNDGWPDVLVGQDFSEKDHLYINQKDGTFKELIRTVTNHISNFSMGNDIADINNDGFLDFISVDMMSESNYEMKTSMSGMNPSRFFDHTKMGLHHQYMYNALQVNNGMEENSELPQFSDIAQLSGVSSTDWSWGPLFFDMDNDGNKDLFVSNGIKRDFRNNDFLLYRKKRQEEVTKLREEGKSFDQKAYVRDILNRMPTRKKENYFFSSNGNLVFSNKSNSWAKPVNTSSNGAAYADFDNDGDLDLIVNNSDDVSFIYRNNSSDLNPHNFLAIKLVGGEKNTMGIGTRVLAYCDGRKQVLEQQLTRGFQSSVSPILHFGIGQSKIVDSIRVIWPNGKAQLLTDVPPNQIIVLHMERARVNNKYDPLSRKTNLFRSIPEKESGIHWLHQENDFNDFELETLLPHRMSRLGPGLSVADVNGDGLDDFYVGGAKGQSGVIYQQLTNGGFIEKKHAAFLDDKRYEDTGSLFFDADGDGDKDLYVVSGGYEMPSDHSYYMDRFYENKGKGNFVRDKNSIPQVLGSGLSLTSGDYDNDGDLDLFVGTRVKPMGYGEYTKSYVLENKSESGNIRFEDVTEEMIPEMLEHPMVTDALWVDIDQDNRLDLVVANEWGNLELFLNQGSSFKNATKEFGLDQYTGWWYSIAASDLDQDGDMDLVAGNLGLNYKYKATQQAPFYMYVNDFDDNATKDIVLGYSQDSTVYPLRGRQCSSGQMPFIKKKFESYDAFAKANIQEVYGEKLSQGIQYKVTNFASGTFINEKAKGFHFVPFENMSQLSSVNGILVDDYNDDGHKDIVLLGNMYGSEVETPRNDASYGSFLKGNGIDFKALWPYESGLYMGGDIKQVSSITLVNNKKGIIVAKNNGPVQIVEVK